MQLDQGTHKQTVFIFYEHTHTHTYTHLHTHIHTHTERHTTHTSSSPSANAVCILSVCLKNACDATEKFRTSRRDSSGQNANHCVRDAVNFELWLSLTWTMKKASCMLERGDGGVSMSDASVSVCVHKESEGDDCIFGIVSRSSQILLRR